MTYNDIHRPRRTTALIEAIRQMHFELAETIVDSGVRLDSIDANGQNALHVVCRTAGDLPLALEPEKRFAVPLLQEVLFRLAKKLLESGQIDPEEKDHCGKRPIDIAMQVGAMRIGALLAGSDPTDEFAVRAGGMDIFQALYYRNRDALDALLQQGVESQVLCEHKEMSGFAGKSPLACALTWSDFDAATRMLCAGADPNFRMTDEQTAFTVWMQVTRIAGTEEQYRCLLKQMLLRGWNPEAPADREGNTALAVACRHAGYAPGKVAVRFLLEKGVDTDAANLCGQTPLMVLYGGGYWNGRIPLLPTLPRSYPYGRKYCGADEEEILEALLTAGADVHRRDKWGNSLLHYIAASCYDRQARQAAEILADFSLPDIAWTNNEGQTAIDLATDKGSESLVKFLLRHI